MADLWRLKGSQFFDADGDPLAGGKFRYYDATTTNPRAVYKDSGAGTTWTQPVTLDSDGRLTDSIYIATGAFKENLYSSAEVQIYSEDNIPGAVVVVTTTYALPETPVITKAADYSIVVGDLGSLFLTNATGGDFTLTLPSAVTAGNGSLVFVQQVGSGGKTTIASTGGQTINGASTIALTRQYSGVTLTSDGANWAAVGTDFQFPTLSKTTTYTVALADYGKLIKANATAAGFTINLPVAATAGDGFRVGIKKTDSSANAVTLDGDTTETIDGATTFVLTNQQQTAWVRSDGANWQIESRPVASSSDAEAIAKANTVKFLTPANLAALGTSETFAGFVELATVAESTARTDTARAVTPAGLAGITPDYQVFTSGTSNWTKPATVTATSRVLVEAWGAGGGGGANATGGGGGGGGYNAAWFLASALTSTVSVAIPAGGAVSTAGGNATFGAFLTGYGGGAGANAAQGGGGGGGGGTGAGASGSASNGGNGGGVFTGSSGGATAGTASAGNAGGGGAGGGGSTSSTNSTGGGSFFGGGGGSGGGNSSPISGGSSHWGGGGGQGGSPSSGAAGSSVMAGAGGATGVAGTDPAGGGGRNAAGGRGEVRVTTFI